MEHIEPYLAVRRLYRKAEARERIRRAVRRLPPKLRRDILRGIRVSG